MKLRINQIQMKGFKPYKDVKVVCFSEGNTVIEGDNGQGKTSISDAITYALLGTGADGVEKAGAKLLNNESKDMFVMLMFEVDGEEHILTRSKKGSKSELILDTDSIDQVELMNWIKQKELFLSIFNPAYFTSLAPKDQKELLQKYLGEVKFDDVIKEMGAEGQRLLDDAFMVPQIYIDRKREELKEANDRENYLKGFIDGKEIVEVPEAKVFDKDSEIGEIIKSLDELNKKPTQLHDISEQDDKNKELNGKLKELEQQKYQLENGPTLYKEDRIIEEKQLERQRLLNEHSLLKSQLNAIKKATCPKCGETFELDPNMKSELESRLSKIVADGKAVANYIDEQTKIRDERVKKHDERVKAESEALSKQIADIQQQLSENDISKLNDENIKYAAELQAEKDDFNKKLQELQAEKQEVKTFNLNRQHTIEQNAKTEKAIEDAKAELSTFEPLKAKLNADIERAKKFNSTKLRMQGEFIGQFLDKVNIQFQKIVKSTGEIKDDFKLQYEGKDFNLLSTSERIKAGLEISNLLMNATGYVYPVFVDNAESIVDIPQLETQMIAAKVKAGEVLR